MADSLSQKQSLYTYADYASWSDEKRWQIIEGKAFSMSPGPSSDHQRISRRLLTEFELFLRGKRCEVFGAPYDIAFPEKGETFESSTNVLQPDISVVCNRDKILDRGCCGAPDLIIEILSPSTAKYDMKDKRKLYERFCVKEYWLVDPIYKMVQVFKLGENFKYSFPETYSENEKIKVSIFDVELEIDMALIFPEKNYSPE